MFTVVSSKVFTDEPNCLSPFPLGFNLSQVNFSSSSVINWLQILLQLISNFHFFFFLGSTKFNSFTIWFYMIFNCKINDFFLFLYVFKLFYHSSVVFSEHFHGRLMEEHTSHSSFDEHCFFWLFQRALWSQDLSLMKSLAVDGWKLPWSLHSVLSPLKFNSHWFSLYQSGESIFLIHLLALY